jgi:hypothetical protein
MASMDQNLLKALEDIGLGLEALVEALESKESSASETGNALKSGDFGKQLESISVTLQSIKTDTQEILKNQKEANQTLLSISREKEREKDKETKEVEDAGGKKKSRIKEGIATILLIAVAVLAIGMAFKLVGKIDFLSVIALSLGIYVIAAAFERVANLKLTIKEAFAVSASMVIMAGAVTVSSWILSLITPISITQAITGILIGVMMTFLLPAAAAMIGAMQSEDEVEAKGFKVKSKGLKIGTVLAAALALPLIMIGVSFGIMVSSWILSLVKPLAMPQALTAIAISLVFAIIAPSIAAIITGITSEESASGMGFGFKKKGINMQSAVIAALLIPIIMVGMSIAIWLSSYILSKVKPIGIAQFLTAAAIAIVFTVLAYGLGKIMSSIDSVNPAKAIVMAAIIPILFIALSYAMMISSEYYAQIKPIGFMQFITAIAISIVFVVLAFAVSLIARAFSGWSMTPAKAAVIAGISVLLFIALSYALMVSSEFLANVTEVPFMKLLNILVMAIALSVSVIAFTVAIWALDKAGFTNPKGMLAFAIGCVLVLAVVLTLTVASHILNEGVYENYPGLGWTIGVGAAMLAFGAAIVGIVYATLPIGGPIGLALGIISVLAIAYTIVEVADILSGGNYKLPGLFDWTLAVGAAFIAFGAAIVGLGALAMTGLGAIAFLIGMPMVIAMAETIVEVADILAGGGDNYKKGPTVEWSTSVAMALGAFSPLYQMLVDNAFWSAFGMGGVGPDDYASAIKTVTNGIVTAANEFAGAQASFENPPPKSWAEGVAIAIGAFSPVYGVLLGQGRSWFDKIFGGPGPTVEDMKKAIITISQGIVNAAEFFNEHQGGFVGSYPNKAWGEGVGAAISSFAPVFTAISATPWYSSPGKTIKALASGIRTVSGAIVDAGRIFGEANLPPSGWSAKNVPNKEWGDGVAAAIKAFGYVFDYMKQESGWFTSEKKVINNMVYAVEKIADAIAYVGQSFANVSDWKKHPNGQWGYDVKATMQEITYASKFLIDQYGESDYEVGWGAYTMARTIRDVGNFLKGSSSYVAPRIGWAVSTSIVMKLLGETDAELMNPDGGFFSDGKPSLGENILKMSKNISSVAKHLYSAAEAFEYRVPDDFIPALRKVMFDFQDLVFEMIEREEDNKSFADKFLQRLGLGGSKSKDPVLVMANRLVQLAKGYDALANSLIKLGGAMSRLNIGSVKDFGGFNASLLSGKMQPGKFETSKKPQTPVAAFNKNVDKKELEKKQQNEEKKRKEFGKDIKEIIKLLKGIEKNTSTLDDYIAETTGGKVPRPGGGLLS